VKLGHLTLISSHKLELGITWSKTFSPLDERYHAKTR